MSNTNVAVFTCGEKETSDPGDRCKRDTMSDENTNSSLTEPFLGSRCHIGREIRNDRRKMQENFDRICSSWLKKDGSPFIK